MPTIDTVLGPGYYAASGRDTRHNPIILIHGAGGSHLDWPPAFRRFPGRRTYSIDLPGHGRSPSPGRRSIEAYAVWVAAWMCAMEMPPAILIGHSMGGAIALELARQAPERVSALVAIGAGVRLPVAPAILDRIVSAPAETIATIIEHAYGRNMPPELKQLGRERMAQIDPVVLEGDFAACDRFDLMGRLDEIIQPTLVLAGAEDRMVPDRQIAALHEGLPDSELVLIEEAGHLVAFERSDEVMRSVGHFLERTASF